MSPTQRQVVLLSLIESLRENGCWCGETHFQKATYFLQELLGVPLDLNVIFYKHGPYSFDLSDAITALRADLLVSIKSREPYGPSLWPTEQAQKLLARSPTALEKYGPAIRFVAERLANKTVAELEHLASALYVLLQRTGASADELNDEILRLNPHLSWNDAAAALQTVKGMRRDANGIRQASGAC